MYDAAAVVTHLQLLHLKTDPYYAISSVAAEGQIRYSSGAAVIAPSSGAATAAGTTYYNGSVVAGVAPLSSPDMARSLASGHGHAQSHGHGQGQDTPVDVVSPGVFSQPGSGLPSPALTGSKKRSLVAAGLESSPASEADDIDANGERKRQPVKRACNECRQQKRLKLECKIEVNFKRIGKRTRNAEMEREIIDLRRQLAVMKQQQQQQQQHDHREYGHEHEHEHDYEREHHHYQHHHHHHHHDNYHNQQQQPPLQQQQEDSQVRLREQPLHYHQPDLSRTISSQQQRALLQSSENHSRYGSTSSPVVKTRLDDYSCTDRTPGPDDAVAGLLDLRSGAHFARSPSLQLGYKKIGNVALPADAVDELFDQFFNAYHPYLPFLDHSKLPDDYYAMSPLLFWTIIAVGCRRSQTRPTLLKALQTPVMQMVWTTLADVPQSYHIVKALALLCTWPFPTSSTSTDPTFMLCGMMMHVAMQIGLHRPSHAQDFSKFKVEFREGELKDRVRTWAVCNIVAQRVSTGYGQPSSTLFDWTLSESASVDPNFRLPREIKSRLDIEMFCAKVSECLYGNRKDPVGLSNDEERYILIKVLSQELEDLQKIVEEDHDPITSLYLRVANLHLRLSAFFDDPSATEYQRGLTALYLAAISLLEASLELKATDLVTRQTVDYTTNYLYQMTLAAGFVLFKLWNSSFSAHIDMEYTQTLFNRTIWGLRNMSVAENDLPQRMTEVLALMWKSGKASSKQASTSTLRSTHMYDTLKLKVKCRMSMSLVYDSVWRWREDFLAKGHSFETFLQKPTNPESTDSDASTTSSNASIKEETNYPITTASDPSLAPAPNTSMLPTACATTSRHISTPTPRPPSMLLEPYEYE
ncbi:hypothetical protein KEM54_005105, partial [Ascosphaera aggregata]